MYKKWIRILIILAAVLVIAIPVAAITYGEQDYGEHPYVGLIGFYDAEGGWLWRCSGTLLAPQLILTAGHCTAPDEVYGTPALARVWFDEEIIYDPDLGEYTNPVFYDGTPIPHPGWSGLNIPETHDIGVVILNEPVPSIDEFGQFPTLGLMDEIGSKSNKRKVILTSVGYGVNDLKPVEISLRTRYQAQSFLINLNNTLTDGWNIMASNNPGQWVGSENYTTGGTCFGDSGGPVFLGGPESDLIVGITSFGNSGCAGADYSYRVDIQDSREFLSQFEDYGIVIP
jgi:secreted trypsin-like serine protease